MIPFICFCRRYTDDNAFERFQRLIIFVGNLPLPMTSCKRAKESQCTAACHVLEKSRAGKFTFALLGTESPMWPEIFDASFPVRRQMVGRKFSKAQTFFSRKSQEQSHGNRYRNLYISANSQQSESNYSQSSPNKSSVEFSGREKEV